MSQFSKEIMDKQVKTLGPLVMDWLKTNNNYLKWKASFWKESKINELLEAEKNGGGGGFSLNDDSDC